MARTVGTSPPSWPEIKDAFENTGSFRRLPGQPRPAALSRFEHGETTVTLIFLPARNAACAQDALERSARSPASAGAYIDSLPVGPDNAFVILATRGAADNDRILAEAFSAPASEPGPLAEPPEPE